MLKRVDRLLFLTLLLSGCGESLSTSQSVTFEFDSKSS